MNIFIIAAAIAVVVCLVPVRAQVGIRPRSFCQGDDIYPDEGDCARRYTRCDGGIFISGFCPEEMVMGPNKRCEIRPECGSPPPQRRRGPPRGKRQASSNNGCPSPQFDCPNQLVFYIYPDWNDCTRFYTCAEGNVDVISCSDFNFQYYNPNLFSCEVDLSFGPAPVQNNICVNRVNPFRN